MTETMAKRHQRGAGVAAGDRKDVSPWEVFQASRVTGGMGANNLVGVEDSDSKTLAKPENHIGKSWKSHKGRM